MAKPTYATAYTFSLPLTDSASRPSFKASPTIAAGDFQISKDGGAFANLTNLPTVTPAGGVRVEVVLTATEMTAQNVAIYWHDAAGGEWDDGYMDISTEPAVQDANLVQIDGMATNGNNATLKLKSLDIRSDDVAVNPLDVRGATGGAGVSGGRAVYVLGGSSGTGGAAGGDAIYAKGGTGTSTRGLGLKLDAPTGGSGLQVNGSMSYAAIFSGGSGGDISGNLAGSIGSLGTTAKADVNAEVKDVLETDTQAEPTSVPAAASSFAAKIGWLFMRLRNKQTLVKSSGIETVYADNSSTAVGTGTDTDDGSTFTKGKMS